MDASGSTIAGSGQCRPLPLLPGGKQGVGKQRESSRLIGTIMVKGSVMVAVADTKVR